MPQNEHGLCLGCMRQTPDDSKPCPHCGWQADAVFDLQYIKPGTTLSARYIVGVYVRKNGEGAMYIGYDNSVKAMVWIHEYFPRTLAQREVETGKVTPLPGCGAQYKALMSDFVDICNEVKRLGITEPVVPIENVISENNTVYAIYKGLELTSFEEYLQANGGKMHPGHAIQMLLPICNTLGSVHTHGHIHRGVSPFTIYADKQGTQLYLWDFALGATRTAGSELDCELFTGYSAPEQYSPNGWQGSWTDVYAMGALLYRAMSGIVPPKSLRIDGAHPLQPLSDLVMDLPAHIWQAVSNAMLISTQNRSQAMGTLVSQLVQGQRPDATAVYNPNKKNQRKAAGRDAEGEKPRKRKRRGGTAKFVILGLACTVLVLFGIIGIFMTRFYPDLMPATGDSGSGETSQLDNGSSGSSRAEDVNTIPSFVGRSLETVRQDAQYVGRYDFSVVEDYNEYYGIGEIYDQSPAPGTPMPERGTVILYVSLGERMETMPSLEGYTLEQAADILANIDIFTYDVIPRYSASAEPGTIISTYPEAGAEFDPKRQTIMLFVMQELSVVEGNSRPPEESSEEESSEPEPEFPPIIFPTDPNFP